MGDIKGDACCPQHHSTVSQGEHAKGAIFCQDVALTESVTKQWFIFSVAKTNSLCLIARIHFGQVDVNYDASVFLGEKMKEPQKQCAQMK